MAERSEREILESLEQRLEAIECRLQVASGEGGEAPDAAARARYGLRTAVFVSAMLAVFAVLTYLCYLYLPELFSITFGLFFVFLILATGLAVDAFVLPTDTFRRISSNAIATAVFWLSIVFLAVSGVRLGTNIISDPFGGEEGTRPADASGYAPQDAAGEPAGAGPGGEAGAEAEAEAGAAARSGAAASAQDGGLSGSAGEAAR
jgi:hypothetical protein